MAPRAVIPSWKIQGFSLASLVSPFGAVVRHSSLGFTPLALRTRLQRRRKFRPRGGKLDAAHISYIILRNVARLGSVRFRAGWVGRAGGLPTELNVTAAGCLRGPLSRYNPPASFCRAPPSPWNKERCAPASWTASSVNILSILFYRHPFARYLTLNPLRRSCATRTDSVSF